MMIDNEYISDAEVVRRVAELGNEAVAKLVEARLRTLRVRCIVSPEPPPQPQPQAVPH